MSSYKQIDCFKINMCFWKLIGIWPGVNYSRNYDLFSKFFISTFIVFYNILFTINFYFVPKNMDSVTEEMIFYFTELACTSKVFTYLVMHDKIVTILSMLESEVFQPTTNKGIEVVDDAKKLNVRYWKIVAVVSVTCNVAHVLIPVIAHAFLSAELKLPVCSYSFLPEDFRENNKYLLYLYQSLGIHVVMWYNVNIDTFILGVIIFAIAQLDIMDENLRNVTICKEIDEDVQENKEVVKYKKLNKCIQHYDVIIKYCNLIQEVFSVTLFVQFSMASYIICVCLFRFTLPAPWQYYVFLATYMTCMILQVMVPCWFGTQVIEKSSNLGVAIYTCDWPFRSCRFKSNMKLFMERFNRPLSITGWKMFPLSLKTFTSIMKTAYSVFNLLQHVQSR